MERSCGMAALLLALLAAACSADPEPAPVATDLERLRSLPYVGQSRIGDEGTGLVHRDPARSSPGYTLYTMQMLARADLIDEYGEVVRSWSDPDAARWARAELLPDGDLLAIGVDAEGVDGLRVPDGARYVMRMTWEGRVRWKRRITAHHDVELTPAGDLLVLTFKRKRLPRIHPQLDVRDDHVTRLDEQGNIVDEISLLEALGSRPDVLSLSRGGPNDLGVRPWLDMFHANSVESMRRPDLARTHSLYSGNNVLVCMRHQNAVAMIDAVRREAVWAWGSGELSGPHDAQVLANGNILIFDNGLGRGWSRVVELNPLTRSVVWEYRATPAEAFYTASKGSAQRLPGGTTLIADSDGGRAFEVTPEGEIVWDFFCPHEVEPGQRAAIVRAVRHGRESIDGLLDGGKE
ncbi:MAG: hypothetical protein GY716_20435 [bacterium]|nr:hypothetical protein [bacterium]